MAPPKQKNRSSLPTREEITAFLSTAGARAGKREIARAFGLKAADKIGLKHLLREMEEVGAIKRSGRLRGVRPLPDVMAVVITGRDRDGDLVGEPLEWEGDQPRPRIVIRSGRRRGSEERAPGIGDHALLRLDTETCEETTSGRVIKILPKPRSNAVGIFRADPAGGGRILSIDKKSRDDEVTVRAGDENGAQDGDLVAFDGPARFRFGARQVRIRERIGSASSEKSISLIAIHTHRIPHTFPDDVLAEARDATAVRAPGREDWTSVPFVTIDPPDAKDHDDAIHAVPDGDPANAGGFVISVAIADVSAYVPEGSALDREALMRGNSVYFPDRVVPMLPERISNDLCSLRPAVDRPALAVRMIVDAGGRKLRHSFHRITLRSAARLSYQQAQDAIDGRTDDATGPILDPVLRPLWDAYACLATARDARGPLFLDLPERKIVLKPDGSVDRVIVPQRLDAHRLIEEFMISANVAAAETLEKAKSPLIYRVHDEPSLEKMRTLGEVLASVGMKLARGGTVRPALFNGVLKQVSGTKHEAFVNEIVLRSQAQAEYAAENYGHFGLNLRRYAHFTSPIRRYADLVVHRALIGAAGLGSDGLRKGTTIGDLAKVAESISNSERRAMAAERDTLDRLIAHHLADRVGATFAGRISGVVRAGFFVKLSETGADGFVPAATLGREYFRHDVARHALVGQDTRRTYRLGDTVEVRLMEAAPVSGAIRFEIADGEAPAGGKRGPVRRTKPSARKGAGASEKVRQAGRS